MTVTETRPEAAELAEAPQPLAPPPRPEPAGLAAYIGTGDHKKVGRIYIGFALVFLLASALTSALLGFESIDQGGYEVFTSDLYFQMLTLNSHGMVFLALLPLLIGLGIYVVPLQVGAGSVAFPRAAAASVWGYVLGGGLMIASYGINGGPGGGDAQAVDLWVVSYALLLISLLLGALCVTTTVFTLRTPGMYLDRVPLFSWSMAVAGVLWLLTLPVLLATLMLIYLDHRYGRVAFGGNFDIYPWIHWIVRQPQVFLYAIPALGIVAEIIATMAGVRQRAHKTMMTFIGLVGALGFGAFTVGVWRALGNEVFVIDQVDDFSIYSDWVFVAMAFLTPLPFVLLLGGWANTMVRGRGVRVSAPTMYALGSILLLLTGAVAAAVAGVEGLDLLQSSWVNGVSNLTILGTLLAALGGLHFWSVKIWARPISEAAGMVTGLGVFFGAAFVAIGDLVAGAYDQPDLLLVVANPARVPFDGVLVVRSAVDTSNAVGTIGWVLVGLSLVVFGLSFVVAMVSPEPEVPAADPWDGQTLEWATASPPVAGNFDEVPFVISAAPLLDEREAAGAGDR